MPSMPSSSINWSQWNLTPAQQEHLQNQLDQPFVSTRPSLDAPWSTVEDRNKTILARAPQYDANNRSRATHNRLVNIGRLASIAPFGVAAGAALAGGSGAAAAGAGASSINGLPMAPYAASVPMASATSAGASGATTGILSRMGSILGSKALEGGVNAGLAIYGQKSQNKANDQARKDVLAAQAKELELEERRLTQEASNANLDREDARALNAAIQALEAKKFALAQEQTAFERGIYERSEANMAPYRALSAKAQQRMSSILGL